MANNLLMPGLSYFRHKLFEFQAFHNQAHIMNFTGIIIYFCGTYYLYAAYLAPPIKSGHNVWGGTKIELEPHIIPRLMLDKKIYNIQIPRTTPSSGHFIGYLLDIHLCS